MFGLPRDGKALILYPNAEFYDGQIRGSLLFNLNIDGVRHGTGVYYNLVNPIKLVTD
jgi:hypothetical protein